MFQHTEAHAIRSGQDCFRVTPSRDGRCYKLLMHLYRDLILTMSRSKSSEKLDIEISNFFVESLESVFLKVVLLSSRWSATSQDNIVFA